MPSSWRPVVALVLIPGFVCALLVAPAHVHEADATHADSVTHRHFEAHHHSGTEIDHPDARVVWLDDVVMPAAGMHWTPPLGLLVPGQEPPASAARWVAIGCDHAAFPHGPPRRTASLRGPPPPVL
jgi:hypothetical protein